MCYNITSNNNQNNILETTKTKSVESLVENEFTLQKITFTIFKNFKELYCKKCCKPTTKIKVVVIYYHFVVDN